MRARGRGEQKQETRDQDGSRRSPCAIPHHAALYVCSIHFTAATNPTHNNSEWQSAGRALIGATGASCHEVSAR
jgi:hypothetical protein